MEFSLGLCYGTGLKLSSHSNYIKGGKVINQHIRTDDSINTPIGLTMRLFQPFAFSRVFSLGLSISACFDPVSDPTDIQKYTNIVDTLNYDTYWQYSGYGGATLIDMSIIFKLKINEIFKSTTEFFLPYFAYASSVKITKIRFGFDKDEIN